MEWINTLGWLWLLGAFIGFCVVGLAVAFVYYTIDDYDWGIWSTITTIVGTIITIIGILIWQNWYVNTISYERKVIEFNSKVEGITRIVEVYDRDCKELQETFEGEIYVNYEGNYVEVHLENTRVLYNNNCVITKENK